MKTTHFKNLTLTIGVEVKTSKKYKSSSLVVFPFKNSEGNISVAFLPIDEEGYDIKDGYWPSIDVDKVDDLKNAIFGAKYLYEESLKTRENSYFKRHLPPSE